MVFTLLLCCLLPLAFGAPMPGRESDGRHHSPYSAHFDNSPHITPGSFDRHCEEEPQPRESSDRFLVRVRGLAPQTRCLKAPLYGLVLVLVERVAGHAAVRPHPLDRRLHSVSRQVTGDVFALLQIFRC